MKRSRLVFGLSLGCVGIAILCVFFWFQRTGHLTTPFVSPDGIPIPFGAGDTSTLVGSVSRMGVKAGKDLMNVSFDNGEKSESMPQGLNFVVTPDTTDISSVSLERALSAGKRYFGYKYTSRGADIERQRAQDAKNGSPLTFRDMFPGEFFASSLAESDIASFAALHHDIQFRSLKDIRLEQNARYVIVTLESGVTFVARDIPPEPDVTFVQVGTVPWTQSTFAIPRTRNNTDADSGFFAYVGSDMLKLSQNLLASTRVHESPIGPENYWWYPLLGDQQTVWGFPALTNVSFCPCTDFVGSMHKCGPGEKTSNCVSRSGVYAWVKNGDSGSWKPITDGTPHSADLTNGPVVLTDSGDYLRVSGTNVLRWGHGVWYGVSALPSDGAAMVVQGSHIFVLSSDGKYLYRSVDEKRWDTLTVAGIDFPVRYTGFLSSEGRLWIAGRVAGETHDRILAWPPLSGSPEAAYYLGSLSENTVNLDSCLDIADGHVWRMPSESEFRLIAPALRDLYPSLPNPNFRIAPITGMYFPVMSMFGGDPRVSSNSDNMLCISDSSSGEIRPSPDLPGCSVIRQSTTASGGEIRFLPDGASLAVRLEDSCIGKVSDRAYKLQHSCAGIGCQARAMSCSNRVPAEVVTDCPASCLDGICADPLEDGSKALISSCPLRIGGWPYNIATPDGGLIISNAGMNTISVINAANAPIVQWPAIHVGWTPSAVITVPTPSGAWRGLESDQEGIGVLDLANGIRTQSLRISPILPPITVIGDKLFAAYTDGRYDIININKELTETLSVNGTIAPSGAVKNPIALVSTGSKLVAIGTPANGSTPGGISIVDTAQNNATIAIGLQGKPSKITLVGNVAYILTSAPDSFVVLDTATNAVVATVTLPGKPHDLAIDGTNAYVPVETTTGNKLVTIDLASNTVVNTLVLPPDLNKIVAISGKGYLIGGGKFVYVVDLAKNDARSLLTLPDWPMALAAVHGDVYILMQNYAASVAQDPLRGQIIVIDAATDIVVNTCG
jgi:hypothetical protein